MSAARFPLAALITLLAVLPVPAAAPPASPLPSQIARWAEELGDDSFAVREEASKKLRAAGAAAETVLEKAATSTDAEVKRRAAAILEEFKWGIYPETPEKVAELIRRYQSSARNEKRPIIQLLLAAGAPGCRALVKIARAEADPLVRMEVFGGIASGLARIVPGLLEEGNRAALESLIELGLAGNVKTGIGHYAAYHLLTDKLPARIAAWELRASKAVVPKAEMEVLAYLYRAAGDLKKARKAAADAERNDLVEAFLYEMADWAELAKLPELSVSASWPSLASYRAAYARLAGDHKLFEQNIKDLMDRAVPVARAGGNVLPYAKGLFLNGRAAEAVMLLSQAGSNARLRYEVHTARLDFKAAFAVVEEMRKANSPELPALEILQARTLHLMGEKAKALATLKAYADKLHKGVDASWFEDLVEVELALGRRDEAFAHTARILSVSTDAGWPRRLFEKLFGETAAEDARSLWALLGWVDTRVPLEKRLATLRRLMEGKATAAEVADLAEKAKGVPPNGRPEVLAEQRRALGEAALKCNQKAKAEMCFQLARSVPATLRLGDLLAARKKWSEAAARYQEAYRLALKDAAREPGRIALGWERRPDVASEELPALALYLHGHALIQAGRADEGKRRIEQAHLLPLGDAEMRYELSKALRRRGFEEAARREHALLRRLGEPVLADPNAYFTGEGMRAAAIEAGKRQQHMKAAEGYEQAFLRVLNPNMYFARPVAYVTVPGHVFRIRALGLAEAGKLDEALAEAGRARTCAPGGLDLVIQLVPRLKKAGRKKDADALFGPTLQMHESILRDHPNAAWVHNQAAWLCACCQRELEKGLGHVRAALKLAPDNPSYHDTLAELSFQLGKKDEAIAAIKKALALHPQRTYFQKQLKRIEAGDPKAPRPSEEE